MHVVTVTVLAAAAVLAMGQHSEAASVHRLAATEEDYDFRPHRSFTDCAIPIRCLIRSIGADDAFKDYGYLRYGRSDD